MIIKLNKINGKLGVAVSGGIDSMVLLHAYRSIEQDILVINIEHGIRGESSVRDTNFVRSYCLLRKIPFVSFSVNVPSSVRPGESVELCARRLRYEVFEKLLSDGTVKKIALAHHADDNAETVLMRIFRGTGLRGLTGICDRGNYIRPLLRYTRKQIEKYAEENQVPFVTDETNLSSVYTRNFIRNDLLPIIRLKYPDVSSALSRLSESAQEADDYLSSVCPKTEEINGTYHLNNLFGYHKILQKYAIMHVIRSIGFLQDFETRHIESVCGLVNFPNNTTIDLPFGLIATRYNDGVIISEKLLSGFVPIPYSESVKITYCGASYGFRKGTEVVRGISFDGDKIPQGSIIRTRADGDIFKRVNGRTKLLSDFLNEKKLSKPEKDKILVLSKGNEVYAILGLETADCVKITNETKNIIHIIKE